MIAGYQVGDARSVGLEARGAVSPNGWLQRHRAAIGHPTPVERGPLLLLQGLAEYADAYQRRFESPIGADFVLGAHWLYMLRGVRGLLNGELGRLDGGTLDATILAMHKAAGFEGEL